MVLSSKVCQLKRCRATRKLAGKLAPLAQLLLHLFDERAAVPCRVLQRERGCAMYNIFYIIGVIVVVLFILGYLGLR